MFAGMPIAFALGAVATVFMIFFMPSASVDTITQNVYEEMASITLLSIPLFILKGSAIGRSRAGQDLYGALHAWMHRIPGGLGIANVFACALFAAMAGSSPATCSAIGSAGIPEMRKRGYSRRLCRRNHRRRRHARHPAAALDHHDPLCGCGRAVARPAVPRAIGPALLLVALFAIYAMWQFRQRVQPRQGAVRAHRRAIRTVARRHDDGARQIRAAAARAAIRHPADRRDDRALWRLCDAVGDGRAWARCSRWC